METPCGVVTTNMGRFVVVSVWDIEEGTTKAVRTVISSSFRILLSYEKRFACFESNLFRYTFAAVHSNKLIKKGGGIGPTKPWQPI